MELPPEESLRAIPADSKFLFPADNDSRARDRIAHFAVDQRLAFNIRHPCNRVQARIRGLSTLQNGPERQSEIGHRYPQ